MAFLHRWDIERLKHCVFKGKIYSQCFSGSTWEGFLTIHCASGLWGIVPLSTNTSVQDFYEHQRIPVRFGQRVGQNSGPSTWLLVGNGFCCYGSKPYSWTKKTFVSGNPVICVPVDSEVRHSTRKFKKTMMNNKKSDIIQQEKLCIGRESKSVCATCWSGSTLVSHSLLRALLNYHLILRQTPSYN